MHCVFGLADVIVEHVDGVSEHRRGVTVEDLGEREPVTQGGPPGQVLVVDATYRFGIVLPFPAVHGTSPFPLCTRRSLPFRSPAVAADDQVLMLTRRSPRWQQLATICGVHG